MVLNVAVSSNLNWGGDRWQFTLDADAKGYFAYLPAVFIYGDPNLGFFEAMEQEKYHIESQYYDYRVTINGHITNKYFCGTALMISPFYLLAHGYASLLVSDSDGFAYPYILAVMLAALFWLMVGLYFLDRFLTLYGVRPLNRSLVLLAAAYGTHLFNYSVVEPGYSHVYSFALFCVFLVVGHNWSTKGHSNSFLLLCALIGIIALVRPSNLIVVLALPFVTGNLSALHSSIKKTIKRPGTVAMGLALFTLIASLQFQYNYWATGRFFIDTYSGEGFNFASPHFWDVLFSYKKGLFVYTPTCFLALLGLYPMFHKNMSQAILWVAFMTVSVYVISSWHNWWYGGSFSMRPLVEYLPFFLIPLGLALEHFKVKWKRLVLITLVFSCLIVNQIQTYQYRYYHIHYEEMTKERYWDVFLRVDRLL